MNMNTTIENKILQQDELKKVIVNLKKENKKIVFSNGCFDIIHKGHIDYLSKAKQLGDILIIGLNSDSSVRRIKGSSRPIQDESARSWIMASLFFVDYVVLFDEDTPYNLIKTIEPDVLVKGADYKKEDIVGYDIVSKNNGRVETIEFLQGYSTTNIVRKIESETKYNKLNEIIRQTHLKFVKPNMISEGWQGEFLSIICRILKPKRILEIGTFSGYATTCFALSSENDCRIDTIEVKQEYEDFLKESFLKNNIQDKINIHFGEGLNIIPTLPYSYDLIFIDAEKIHYPQYYDLCIEKLNKGGLLIADNVLWYGKVDDESINDKRTLAIREFNEKANKDARVENIIVPLRDGLMLVVKK